MLLEQLPLNVQTYSLGTLYTWVRRAVIGYGVYQKASPWLKYASRGLYAGRLLATASPLSLGAMWAASELGRRGQRSWWIRRLIGRRWGCCSS